MNRTNRTFTDLNDDFVWVRVLYGFLAGGHFLFVLLLIIMVYRARKAQGMLYRGINLMVISLIAGNIVVWSMSLRIVIGRSIFPCFLYMSFFFVMYPPIIIPIVLRTFRFFLLYTISRLQTKISQEGITEERKNRNAARIIFLVKIRKRKPATFAFFILLSLHAAYWLIVTGAVTGITGENKFSPYGCTSNYVVSLLAIIPIVVYAIVEVAFIVAMIILKVNDSYGISRELVVTTISYSVFCCAFVIVQSIPQYTLYVEQYFPAAIIPIFAIVIENILAVLIPVIKYYKTVEVKDDKHEPFISGSFSDIQSTLDDPAARNELKKYAVNSFCPEDILCWEDIQVYKEFKGEYEILKKGREIVKNYLNSGSPMELNLPDPVKFKDDIEEKLNFMSDEELEDQKNESLLNVFDELQTQVVINMADVFKRFRASKK
ncbi:hypothetical protein AKO1_009880 [Acrasis kona]|uniref:RGS domain-containing protein n=1 Tax=Acrasis kona TaxID=1008807 RepID=A0AAW2ZPK5_9EUKA